MKTKKLLATLFTSVFAFASMATLASCNNDKPADDPTNEIPGGNTGGETNLDAEIVDAALKALNIASEATGDLTLPTSGNGGVAISWASSNTDVATIDGSSVVITRPGIGQADVSITLTATLVLNDVTKTKTFTVTVKAVEDDSVTIASTKALAAGTKVTVKGVVSGFVYAQDDVKVKSGFYLTDATDTIYVFGANTAADLSVGDEVYFSATTDVFYGSPQLKLPTDVAKLGSGKEYTFTNLVTDKTVAELVDTPAPANNETTNQGKVYELLAYFKKISTETYVNYKVCDPYNESKGLNVYFKSTIVPGQTYPWTQEFDSFAGKYCKVKFYMYGTSSSGAWRGHVLGFTALSDEESAQIAAKAKVSEELNRLEGLFDSLYESTTEIDLTPTEGYTVTVTAQDNATTLAYDSTSKTLTITPTSEELTETVTIKVSYNNVELEKTISIKSKRFIPTAGNYTATMEYEGATTKMVVGQNNAELVGLRAVLFNITSNEVGSYNNAVGLNKDGSIRLYSDAGNGNELTIQAQNLDNLKLVINNITLTYGAGKNTPTFTVNGATGNTNTAEYTINSSKVVIKNTTSESAQLWITSIEIDYTISEITDLDKAQAEAERLSALINSSYSENATVQLTPTEGYTVAVTPQANATALSFANNTLTVTVGTEVITETLTIAVTYNGQTYTTEAISVQIIGAIPTINSVISAEVGSHLTQGTVVAINSRGFIIKDTTALIYVFKGNNWSCDLTIGDVVKVSGTTELRNGLKQFSSNIQYEKKYPETVTQPTAQELDAAGLDALATATPEIKYISFTGVLSISNNYYNVNVEGTTATGSISYPTQTTELTALNGKRIKVTGYFNGISGSSPKYINIVLVEFEEVPYTDAEKATIELNRLVSLFDEEVYNIETTINLTSTEGYTVAVTPQADATTLAYDSTTKALTITPGSTELTETVTIAVTVGEETQTKTLNIKSILDLSNLTVTTNYKNVPTTGNSNLNGNSDSSYIGLDSNLFNLSFAKNSSSGGALYKNDIRLYKNNSGDGCSVIISINNLNGFTAKIKSIKVVYTNSTYSKSSVYVDDSSVAVTDSNDDDKIGEYMINGTSFTIKNTNAAEQVRIASIEITYSLVASE